MELGNVDRSMYFKFSNGEIARNIYDLLNIITNLDDNSFNFHNQRGDFSNWIKDVLNNNELAKKIKNKNKIEIIEIINDKINSYSTNEEKINNINNNINEIENEIYNVPKEGNIDKALERLKDIYNEKQNESPNNIILHDNISKEDSLINIKDNNINEKLETKKDEKENFKNKPNIDNLKDSDLINESDNLNNKKELELLKHEHENNLILKERINELRKTQDDFEKSLKNAYVEIEDLKKNIKNKNKTIEDLKIESQFKSDKIEELENELNNEIEKNSTTLGEIDSFYKLKKEVKEKDLIIKELKNKLELLNNKENNDFSNEYNNQEIKNLITVIEDEKEKLKKKEDEIDNLKKKYLNEIKELIDTKKKLKNKEKVFNDKIKEIEDTKKILNKKELYIKNQEKSLKKRSNDYEKEINEIKKQLKSLI